MKIHLIDGTYELFRAHFGGAPKTTAPDGAPVGAVRGIIQTLLMLLRQPDATHIACAFDSVIASFRNDLFAGYKTGADVPPDLLAQFPTAERAAAALGIVTWKMIEFEADDAIATAARKWADADGVEQIVICSPDKDLAQAVRGDRVVTLDRRRDILLNAEGALEKYGVPPESIPDYLALVGDAADGIPGVPRWGAKSAATILREYRSLDAIPADPARWRVKLRGAKSLAQTLAARKQDAALYKRLATLRLDVPLTETLPDLRWRGARRKDYATLCAELGLERLADLPHKWDE